MKTNPTEACDLPKVYKKEIKPLEQEDIRRFLDAIQGHRFEIACTRYRHPIEDVAVSLPVENGSVITVHASRCQKCNLVFMQKAQYLRLRKEHRILIADFCELSEDGYSIIPPGKFAAESPLTLCGYNVSSLSFEV